MPDFTAQPLATSARQPAPAAQTSADNAARREAMRAAAMEFEAVFIAQMLEHAGVAKTPTSMGGGAGEDGFRSMMLAEQGRQMARAGGIGLADDVYRSMLRAEGLAPDTAAGKPMKGHDK